LGDINEHLIVLEKKAANEESELDPGKCPAKTMLVLFVKGLLSKLAFPYAQFASTDLCGELMYNPVWKAVGQLELCSFKVLALVCDGLAANRKLFCLHNPDLGSDDILYKIPNPYSDDGRELFFISDSPHVIKTGPECLVHSKRHLSVCFRLYFLWPLSP